MKIMIFIILLVVQNFCFAEKTKKIDSASVDAVAKGLAQLYSQALKTSSIAKVCILKSYKLHSCNDKTNPYNELFEDLGTGPCTQEKSDKINKERKSKYSVLNELIPSEKKINSLWAEIIKRLIATSNNIDLASLLNQDKDFYRWRETNAHGATFSNNTKQELCNTLVVSSKVAYAELIWTAEYWFGDFIPNGVTRYGLNK